MASLPLVRSLCAKPPSRSAESAPCAVYVLMQIFFVLHMYVNRPKRDDTVHLNFSSIFVISVELLWVGWNVSVVLVLGLVEARLCLSCLLLSEGMVEALASGKESEMNLLKIKTASSHAKTAHVCLNRTNCRRLSRPSISPCSMRWLSWTSTS